MKFKKMGLIIAGSVLWGRNAPIDSLTDWNLQHAIKKLNTGEFELIYILLPSIRKEAVKTCIQTRYIADLGAERLNSICFCPNCEDVAAFIGDLESILPECKELGVEILGSGLATNIFEQRLAEFTINKRRERITLLTEIGSPDYKMPMLQQTC